MSGKKVPSSSTDISDPKTVADDEYADSGFISGQISEQLVSGEDIQEELASNHGDSNIEADDSDPMHLDSGVILSESLSNLKISDGKRNNFDDDSGQTKIPEVTFNIVETRLRAQDVPPWQILFVQDEDGDTQLHIAAVRGCQASVRTLVRVCTRREWLDVPNDYGHTALHLAVLASHHVVARMLLIAGAELGCRDCTGETPLHKAAAAGDLDSIKALLAPLPNQTLRPSTVIEQKNYNGATAIHLAALGGYTEAIHMLMYYGADINAREGLGGYTALHIAAERGDARTAQYILERCAGVAIGTHNYAGKTARKLAKNTKATSAFAKHPPRRDEDYYTTSEDEEDSDDDEMSYESGLSLFNSLRGTINVA